MMNILKDPKMLTDAQQSQSVRLTGLWVTLGAMVLTYLTWLFVGMDLEFEHPLYLVQTSLKLGLAGFPIALLRSLLVLTVGFGAVQWFENSKLGQRLEENKALVFAAILIAVAVAFGVK